MHKTQAEKSGKSEVSIERDNINEPGKNEKSEESSTSIQNEKSKSPEKSVLQHSKFSKEMQNKSNPQKCF